MRNGTAGDLFLTPIADIKSFVQTVAAFLFKVLTGLIAGRTGCTLYAAKYDLATGIGLFTMITMNTEISVVVKAAFVIPVRHTMSLYFFGYGSWILA